MSDLFDPTGSGNADCDAFGHDDYLVYEDADTRQWECRRCGAEGIEDVHD
jgi:hypothetical protein